MSDSAISELRGAMKELGHLGSAAGLLAWDQRTKMPVAANSSRAEQLATISRIMHEMTVSDEIGELIERAEVEVQNEPPDSDDRSLLRLVKQSYDRMRIIPVTLQEELSRSAVLGYDAWVKARGTSDFSLFGEALAHNIELTKEVIALERASDPSFEEDYDVLLDNYEPELTAVEVDRVFARLKEGTLPLVETVRKRAKPGADAAMRGSFPVKTQKRMALDLAKALGLDEETWRLDTTGHPFALPVALNDIRITTRFYDDHLSPAFFGTMHEFGHGLYERHVNPKYASTPVQRGASMAWHESQSRLWENLVGRGRPFWDWGLPFLREYFPKHFAKRTPDELYRAVNAMGPSLIRVEADELTYNFHIILRYELERDIFAGRVFVQDLPGAWNAKVKKYLGLEVEDDAKGVLQDVHWGGLQFGYFPTYTLGNVISLQIWERIRQDLPALDEQLSQGDFAPLRTWLNEHIHQYGKKYKPLELLEKVTGQRELDPEPLITYLTNKVEELYGAP